MHKNANRKAFEEKLRSYAVDNDLNTNLLFAISPLRTVKYDIQQAGNVFEQHNSLNLTYIRTFLFVGVLLILSVFFNYLNILINSIVQRTREMNLRKVSGGAHTRNLFVQLFVEIGLLILFVILLSLSVAELTASSFEKVFQTVILKHQLFGILFETIAIVGVSLCSIVFVSLYRFLQKNIFQEKHYPCSNAKNTVCGGENKYGRSTACRRVFFMMSALAFWRQVRFMQTSDWGIQTKTPFR